MGNQSLNNNPNPGDNINNIEKCINLSRLSISCLDFDLTINFFYIY